MIARRTLLVTLAALALAACGGGRRETSRGQMAPGKTPEMQRLVAKWARFHDIPESLLHRVIQRKAAIIPPPATGPITG